MGKFGRTMKRKGQKDKEQSERALEKAFEKGRLQGVDDTVEYLSRKIYELKDVQGFGEKRVIQVAEHLGFEIIEKGEET